MHLFPPSAHLGAREHARRLVSLPPVQVALLLRVWSTGQQCWDPQECAREADSGASPWTHVCPGSQVLNTHREVWCLRTSARPHQDCSGTRSPVSLSSDCSGTPTSCDRVGVFPPLPAGEGRAPPWPETAPPSLTSLWMFQKVIWVTYHVGTGREGDKEVAGIGAGPLLPSSLFVSSPCRHLSKTGWKISHE